MRLSLKMIDPSDYKIGAVAMVAGWAGASPVGTWLALHPLTTYAAQGAITLAFGLCTLIAQHLLRGWLKRNFPEEARIDWFKYLRPLVRPALDLIRAGIERLRQRKEP
jgi:hypothetical protein